MAAIGLAGCQRGDPLATVVDAKSPAALERWRMKQSDRFSREQWSEFSTALQELRLGIMSERAAKGSAAIEAELVTRIDGRTYREVLILAHRSIIKRHAPVLEELKRAIDANALLVLQPGDVGSAQYLDGFTQRQQERFAKTTAEVNTAAKRVAELDPLSSEAKLRDWEKPVSLAAEPLTREEAMARITQLIREQQDAARLRFGDWPMKIDPLGTELSGSLREDFVARRDVAAAKGHVVMAVRLGDRWSIYDAPARAPTFSPAVTANLHAADRLPIEAMWWAMQAEIWARRRAREEADAAK